MSSSGEGKQHITCTDELNNMHIMGTEEGDRCANCGKEGSDLNICNKCKSVHYCNVSCKKKHKSKHKKKCDRRVAELHDEVLFKDHPPAEECPICMLPLPLDVGSTFHPCCGKRICCGCIVFMMKEDKRKGKKKIEDHICAFCRTPETSSDEERNRRLEKLVGNGNAEAYHVLAQYYAQGTNGLQQDMAKANELWRKAGELGCAEAYSNLGMSYNNGIGVEADKKKAKHYYELAAINGDVMARHNLGCMEGRAGNYHRALKHFLLAARAGFTQSLDSVKKGFMNGDVMKDEYANTLRSYHERQTEMKSDARDQAAVLEAQCAAKRKKVVQKPNTE